MQTSADTETILERYLHLSTWLLSTITSGGQTQKQPTHPSTGERMKMWWCMSYCIIQPYKGFSICDDTSGP